MKGWEHNKYYWNKGAFARWKETSALACMPVWFNIRDLLDPNKRSGLPLHMRRWRLMKWNDARRDVSWNGQRVAVLRRRQLTPFSQITHCTVELFTVYMHLTSLTLSFHSRLCQLLHSLVFRPSYFPFFLDLGMLSNTTLQCSWERKYLCSDEAWLSESPHPLTVQDYRMGPRYFSISMVLCVSKYF